MRKTMCGIAMVAFLMGGCSSLQMNIEVQPSDGDQIMEGRTAERTFFDSARFTFPLAVSWEYDATAGFGRSPMIVVGSTMFVGTLRGELHALNLETGKRLGYLKTYSPVYAAPVFFRSLLIFGTETGKENIVAYDLKRGEIRWTRDLGGIVASPLVHNDAVIAGGLNGKIVAFDEYGTEIWSYDTKSEIRSSPAVSDTVVYCATIKGEIFALSSKDGRFLWRSATNNAVYAGITVSDRNVFVASRDSSVYILNRVTGALDRRIFVRNKVMATPTVRNGVVFIASLEGTVGAYSVETGSLLWEFRAKNAINTTVVGSGTALFVVSLDKHLYALDPENGTVLWKYELPARLKTTPIIWKNALFVAAEDKLIYRFDSAK